MDPIAIAAFATKYVLQAIKSLGEQVLAKSEDATSDAAVGLGARVLRLLLRRRSGGDRSDPETAALESGIERRVLSIARDPGQPNASIQLEGAIEELLRADRMLLTAVAELQRQAPPGDFEVHGNISAPVMNHSSVGGSIYSNSTVKYGDDPATLATRYFAAGEQHLAVGDCSAAVEDLRQARSYDARNPDTYYLGAIALLGRRSAFRATLETAREVERMIQAAVVLEDRAVFHYFLAYVRFDFYERNSLRPPGPWQASLQYAWSKGVTQPEIDSLFHLLAVENPFPSPR
jgi:hypothetical protein